MMADYYVSTAGADNGSGALNQPWKTVTRLNAAFTSGQVACGDRVFLKRGDTFYGRLRQPGSIDPVLQGWLRIGSFGIDPNLPLISGYKLLTAWTQTDANTWQTNLSASGGYDGAQGSGDVGFLKVDGIIRGVRKALRADLTAQWDFYTSGSTLYVCSTANPTTLAGDVRCSVDGDGSDMRSGVELADAAIYGHGGNGVAAPGLGGSTRMRTLGCHIGECGGSALEGYGDGNVRYGNGIQGWVGTRDWVVEGNQLHDVYDVAWTMQGGAKGATDTFTDILFRRNLTYRSSQSMEFWYGGDGPGFVNVVSEYNTCLLAGYGWGAVVRPEQESRVHLLTFAWGSSCDITVRRNIFADASHAFRYASEATPGLVLDHNVVLLRAGTLMQDGQTQTIKHAISNGAGTDHLAVIAGSDVLATVIANLDTQVPGGMLVGEKLLPIHAPWRAA